MRKLKSGDDGNSDSFVASFQRHRFDQLPGVLALALSGDGRRTLPFTVMTGWPWSEPVLGFILWKALITLASSVVHTEESLVFHTSVAQKASAQAISGSPVRKTVLGFMINITRRGTW